METQIGVLILGLLALFFGAEWVVKGSSGLALALGIKPVVIGLTIIAFGTSSPEFVVSLVAALKKSEGIAVGNIIGSNIANIGLVLGVSALVSPLKVELEILRRELPVMLVASVLLVVMLVDQKIGFWDKFILFSGLLGYLSYHLFSAVRASKANRKAAYEMGGLDERNRRLRNTLLMLVGFTLLIGGAHLTVRAAVFFARALGIGEVVVGLTLVAVGTCLPELATSIVSARHKKSDICVGNVIGSNILNILFVMCIVAMIVPINADRSLLFFELPVMLLFSFAVVPLMKTGFVLNRIEGAILLVGYGVFILVIGLR